MVEEIKFRNPDDKYEVNECIYKILKKLGISRKDFAKKLGVSYETVGVYINKKRAVPTKFLIKVICIFNVNPLFFYLENEPMFNVETFPEIFDITDINLAKKWLKEILLVLDIPREYELITKQLTDQELITYANGLKTKIKETIKF